MTVIGEMVARVQYEQQKQDLVLTVVEGDGPCLLGRNWLQLLTLNWQEIKAVSQHVVGSLDYLMDKYGEIFAEELGTISHSVQSCMSIQRICPSFSSRDLFLMPLRVQLKKS